MTFMEVTEYLKNPSIERKILNFDSGKKKKKKNKAKNYELNKIIFLFIE
jgi:hypothetical protein